MKIKTIAKVLSSIKEFDDEVNEYLGKGYILVKRDILDITESMSEERREYQNVDIYVLYAELELVADGEELVICSNE